MRWTWLLFAGACGGPTDRPSADDAGVDDVVADLRRGLGLHPAEADELRTELERTRALGGSTGHARNLVWVAVTKEDCRDGCLVERVAAWNRCLAANVPDEEAADRVLDQQRIDGRPRRSDLVACREDGPRGTDRAVARRRR